MQSGIRTGALGLAALLALALGQAPAAAQVDKETVATDLQLSELGEPYNGSMAMVEGQIEGSEPDRYTVANLSIFQPVKVALVADGRPVTLKLGKFEWSEDFGGGSTGSAGRFVKTFTTQGDLLLSVSGDAGAGYSLIIWAGEEVPPEFEPVLVSPSEAGGSRTMLIALGLGAVLLAGLAFLWFRRRKGTAA